MSLSLRGRVERSCWCLYSRKCFSIPDGRYWVSRFASIDHTKRRGTHVVQLNLTTKNGYKWASFKNGVTGRQYVYPFWKMDILMAHLFVVWIATMWMVLEMTIIWSIWKGRLDHRILQKEVHMPMVQIENGSFHLRTGKRLTISHIHCMVQSLHVVKELWTREIMVIIGILVRMRMVFTVFHLYRDLCMNAWLVV